MRDIGFYLIVGGFFVGVGVVSVASVPFQAYVLVLMLAGVFFAARRFTKRQAYVVAAAVLLAVVIGGVRTHFAPTTMPPVFKSSVGQRVVLEGVLVRPPDVRETGKRLTVEVVKGGERMRIIAVAPPHTSYRVGDRLSVTGVLKRPEPFDSDGGRVFAYDAFLAKDGVFALVQPAHVTVLGRENNLVLNFLAQLQDVRDGFMRALARALPDPQSALAAGLIAGGKQGLGKELLDAFTVSGLLPIVVLSGYNVMIVAEGVMRALRFLPQRYAFALGGASILLFVLAAGAGAASFRAGIMALIALVARATGKTYAAARALVLVLALMLLWNPLLLVFDPGLQFSFIATLGLIIGTPLVLPKVCWVRSVSLRDIVASTIAAQIAVLPLLLFHTGNLSLVAPFANVLVLPVVPAAMAAGALGALAAFLPVPEIAALLAGLPAYVMLTYIIMVAERSAVLPFAHVTVPAFPFWLVAVAYAGLVAWVMRMKRNAPAKAGALRGAHRKV